jgi:hypothetical protein
LGDPPQARCPCHLLWTDESDRGRGRAGVMRVQPAEMKGAGNGHPFCRTQPLHRPRALVSQNEGISFGSRGPQCTHTQLLPPWQRFLPHSPHRNRLPFALMPAAVSDVRLHASAKGAFPTTSLTSPSTVIGAGAAVVAVAASDAASGTAPAPTPVTPLPRRLRRGRMPVRVCPGAGVERNKKR